MIWKESDGREECTVEQAENDEMVHSRKPEGRRPYSGDVAGRGTHGGLAIPQHTPGTEGPQRARPKVLSVVRGTNLQ